MSNVTANRTYKCGIEGTGAADPTKRYGDGITVTRTAAGVYKFSFASHPGAFLDAWGSLRADTPSGVKGYSISGDTFVAATSSANAYVEISLWDASNNAVDLADNQYLGVTFEFSEVSTVLVA
jgi:hypothetical protein